MHKSLIMAAAKTAFKTFFRIKTFLIVLNHVLFVSTITYEQSSLLAKSCKLNDKKTSEVAI